MIIWKQQLMQMHLIPIFKKILVLALLINLVGCINKNDDEYITIDEWFNCIITSMKIEVKDNNVQSLINWEILNEKDNFALNNKLNNDLFAKTILRINKEYAENYLEIAYQKNIISNIKKDDLVKKDEALKQLELAVNKRNNQSFINNYDINDISLNTLLTLLPQKIIIHLEKASDEFIKTLICIFENRIELTSGSRDVPKNPYLQ